MKKLLKSFLKNKKGIDKIVIFLYGIKASLPGKNRIKLNSKVNLEKITKNVGFWGYYDKSPEKGNKYIYSSFKTKQKKYDRTEKLIIEVNQKKIAETYSWNLQQGCMLTWLNKSEIIFNFFRDGFKSKIINIETGAEKEIDYPIYSVSSDSKFSISLNFSRLDKLRPDYGYSNEKQKNINKISENDGIYFIDLEKNEKKLIISLKELFDFETRKDMIGAYHKVNHIEISPENKRVMFLHRWIDNKGIKRSRLFTSSVDGTDLYLLSDDDLVSHCTWRNETEIVGWMRKKKYGEKYFLHKDKTNIFKPIGNGLLTKDGHPSFSKDGQWMLTDTYPDLRRISKLLLYNMNEKKEYLLGEFYSPMKRKIEERCDLHPRFNSSTDSIITFDSDFTSIRNMYSLNIEKIISKGKLNGKI